VTARRYLAAALLAAVALAPAGCSLLDTRDPEDPLAEGGTFLQPDTPEQVVDNLRAAIAELNTLNYRRSLSEALEFRPTATAEARDAVWSTWSRAEEEQYFGTLVAAAAGNTGHGLVLNDESFTLVDASHYRLDATYVLTVIHTRPDAPTRVQGRLLWTIEQRTDGLWELSAWTDQELGTEPSWSDLKAEFVK
jgi:hypothetical protein